MQALGHSFFGSLYQHGRWGMDTAMDRQRVVE